MNKRKGSLYEQRSRVTPMLKNSGQTVTEKYVKDKGEFESWHHIQPNSQLNSNQHHQRLEQIQKPHQFKLKENINTFKATESQNQHKLQQTSKQAKQIRSHSAQRSSSLDKRRQEVYYWDKNYFIENTDMHKNNNHQNLDLYVNHARDVNQNQINDKNKKQVQHQIAFNTNQNQINNCIQYSLKIERLRDEYNREQGRNLQIQESLANQMEDSTHYQEDFEYTDPNINERNEYMYEEEESYIPSLNQHARAQYRKPQAKINDYQKQQTFDQIKQLIQKQQQSMKYYLEQRTQTDTTDDQNVSINPNNKSSSDEAILTSADQKSSFGNENHISGNYIASHFHYPNNSSKQYSKAFTAKEISSSHDTTKLLDDESGNKQQNSDNNIKANFENTFNQKDYQEYLSESHIYPKYQFNNTHPSANNKMHYLACFDKQNQIRSSCSNRYEVRRKNTPSQGSSQKNNKKALSIISDQFEDILECKVIDHQLCPKSEIKKNNLYTNPNKIQKRSKSETKNSRNFR
ncbi:hypothetical protein ABPG74_010440 [Tetrahymena malaccensis]